MEKDADERVTLCIFIATSAFDIAVNAAAGAAAAATGAHVNGSDTTAKALQVGAIAGTTKAGILAFCLFVGWTGLDLSRQVLLILLASSFGLCVLITAQVSNLVLGETPTALLIAAVVAAIPLAGECVSMYSVLSGMNGDAIFNQPGTFSINFNLMEIGLDALGGYVFARMSHNEGMDICSYGAAAAAGGVYGAVTGVTRLLSFY